MLLFVPVVSLTHTPIGREHSTVQGFPPRLAPIHLRHGRSSLQQRQAWSTHPIGGRRDAGSAPPSESVRPARRREHVRSCGVAAQPDKRGCDPLVPNQIDRQLRRRGIKRASYSILIFCGYKSISNRLCKSTWIVKTRERMLKLVSNRVAKVMHSVSRSASRKSR